MHVNNLLAGQNVFSADLTCLQCYVTAHSSTNANLICFSVMRQHHTLPPMLVVMPILPQRHAGQVSRVRRLLLQDGDLP
jgi:hypothetical protein